MTPISGQKIFQTIYGETAKEVCYVHEQTPDGGYIMVGDITTNGLAFEIFMVKTNENGEIEWTKGYGGMNEDRPGASVESTSDGGYIITGLTRSFYQISPNFEIFILKTDANGDTLWTKRYGDFIWPYSSDYGVVIRETDDGGYILAGASNSRTVLMKLDQMGV